ncbi:MAG: o-succinylbenzoate synthase [Candidatus Zixiibacteriota bacterium]
MRIRSSLHRYHLDLVRPLRLGRRQIDSRDGIIVRMQDDAGNESLGEVAPLPGFSKEDLSDTLAQVSLVLPEYGKSSLPNTHSEFIDQPELLSRLDALYHSVSFGISTALFMLYSAREGRQLHTLIRTESPNRVTVNAFLSGSREEMVARAKALHHQGYRAVKLKVGVESIEHDVETVGQIRAVLDKSVALRLDANRRWTLEQANSFLNRVAGLDIEYIEEPINNLRMMPELQVSTPVPIALDESLSEYFATGMQTRFVPAAVVLKPTLVGGWGKCLSLHKWAQSRGAKVVVSSAFESAVGMEGLMQLAAVVSEGIPCGLDTSSWFRSDLPASSTNASAGEFTLPEGGLTFNSLNQSLLTAVANG